MTGGRGASGKGVREIWDAITLVGTDLVFSRNLAGSLGDEVIVDLSSLAGDGDVQLAQRIDEESGGDVLYIGEAQPGTADNAASWRIKRITFTVDGDGDTDSTTEWANGAALFDRVWDNRLTESYS